VARVVHGPPPGAPTQAPDSRAISGVRQRRKGHPEGKTCPDAGLPGFRHHFSHAWPDRRGAAGDLTGAERLDFSADAAPLRCQRPIRQGAPQLRPGHGRGAMTRATPPPAGCPPSCPAGLHGGSGHSGLAERDRSPHEDDALSAVRCGCRILRARRLGHAYRADLPPVFWSMLVRSERPSHANVQAVDQQHRQRRDLRHLHRPGHCRGERGQQREYRGSAGQRNQHEHGGGGRGHPRLTPAGSLAD
jgi:hypothetical protein